MEKKIEIENQAQLSSVLNRVVKVMNVPEDPGYFGFTGRSYSDRIVEEILTCSQVSSDELRDFVRTRCNEKVLYGLPI